MSVSSGACAKHTMRHAPVPGLGFRRVVQQDEPSGAAARSRRLTLGAHVAGKGEANGASPAGAGISRTRQIPLADTVART